MTNDKENKEKIDQIEDDLNGDILGVEKDDPSPSSENPWDNEKVKEDIYDDRDSDAVRDLFVVSMPNKQYNRDGSENKGYQKLCLSRNYSQFAPEETIDCVVIRRIRPNIESVPYKEAEGMEPWERTLGYSLDGFRPTPNRDGEYMPSCIDPFTEKPYAMCSQATQWESNKIIKVPLAHDEEDVVNNKVFDYLPDDFSITCQGECPRARWGNTMEEADRKKYGIRTEKHKPWCDEHIILYCWHLKRKVLFAQYFKRASLQDADDFLRGFRRGGPQGGKLPLYRYISRISIKHIEEYAIPTIVNTGVEANYNEIKPIVDWFDEREGDFIRNLAISLQDMKAKADEQAEFPPKEEE